MHTLVEINAGATQGTHVPAFLAKLWKLVDDSTTNDLIYWCETGNSFIIRNQAKFARDLLPLYYKHNNMASFVRQLNMYGFHKVVSVEQGGLKVDKDEMEFAHPFFLRGQESSLELIKRKIPAAKHEESRIRPDSLHKVLMDVRHMKGRQENMDTKLLTMKRENEALWRELASLRQKHAKQTQIVSKLLQFLVGMMSSQTPRLGPFKRRMPLMLNDIDGTKNRKLSPHNDDEEVEVKGPVIHDVTEIFDTDSMDEQDHSDYLTGSSGSDGDSHPLVESPPAPESILGLPRSSSPDLLLTVDPSVLNPLNKDKDGQNTKAKSRNTARKTNPASTSTSNFLNSRQEMMKEIASFSSAANNQLNQVSSNQQLQPPTTYYLTGADGTIEPVHVVLSIPEKNMVQTSDIGINTDSTTSSTTTSTVSQPQKNITAQTITTSTDIVPMMSEGIVGRNQNQVINHSQINPKFNPDDLDLHLDDVQLGLDNLRDILKNEDYKMEHSTLLGASWPYNNSFDSHQLFGDGELGNLDLSKLQEPTMSNSEAGTSNSISGQELVSYNPSLFELTEDDSQFFDDSSNMFLDDELESMLTTEKSRLHKSMSQPQSGQSTLSFETALNGQHNSGLTTPVVGSILGGITTPNSLGTSTTLVSNISGAGKRKMK